jgi:large subunit ribosomal protein L18
VSSSASLAPPAAAERARTGRALDASHTQLGFARGRLALSSRPTARPADSPDSRRFTPATRRAVRRSNKHIYAQVIDDAKHHIVAAATSLEADLKEKGLNIETAKEVGSKAAQRAKDKGIEMVYFDRNGYKYHGRIAALADGAREAGLVF